MYKSCDYSIILNFMQFILGGIIPKELQHDNLLLVFRKITLFCH